MTPSRDIALDVARDFRLKHERDCPISGIPVEPRRTPKHSLGQLILAHLPVEWQPGFTGQITVEVHCKDGVVRDMYIAPRKKMAETQG